MSIARRNFLKTAARTSISAGLALTSAHLIFAQQPGSQRAQRIDQTGSGDFRVPIEAEENALFHFRLSTFKPYVGDIFELPNDRGEMITLKLIRANEFRTSNKRMQKRTGPQPTGFSLTFSASEQLPSFSSIHKMSHPALGSFDLFLTTREPADGTFLYEAVFSQLP